MSNYFRLGNLTALRELALLWLADRVDEGLEEYRDAKGIRDTWAARDRIIVAVTGGAESITLIRRGLRIAGRVAGRELLVVHVVEPDGTRSATAPDLMRARELAEANNATWHTVVGDDVATALVEFARTVNASQIVLGVSRTPLVRPDLQPRGGQSCHRLRRGHRRPHGHPTRRPRACGGPAGRPGRAVRSRSRAGSWAGSSARSPRSHSPSSSSRSDRERCR